KLAEVELQADGKKATFFYTADQRVDFRELIKMYAGDFRVKVEMKQIGARQESGKVGGIGSCGRELCCSTWLTDFKSVNTTAARYQNLSINQAKLSGQCGRLKCCLNYELDTYIDALSVFPEHADVIETTNGKAFLQKRDIFKNLMWYSYRESSKQYPLTIERVKEILEQNKQGIKPDELQPVELETTGKTAIKVDAGFVNDVGQITLRSLEKNSRKKGKSRNKGKGGPGENRDRSQQPQQRQARDNQPRQEGGRRPDGGGRSGNRPRPQGDRPQQPKQAQGNRPEQKGGGESRPQQPRQAQGNRPDQKAGGENRPQQGNRQGGSRNRSRGGGGNRPQRPPQGDKPQEG
ncbi:MAG TPA: regulatory iron-sulfur-containing complex subunit RicT, partial [Flavipsychrobacter sp.]